MIEGLDGVKDENNPGLSAFTRVVEDKKILFSHYPVLSDDPYMRGKTKETVERLRVYFYDQACDLNIHGHVHSNDSHTDTKVINI